MMKTDLIGRSLYAGLFFCASMCAETNTPPPKDIVRGKVQSVGDSSLKLATQSGVMNIELLKPVTVYESHPASLSQVKASSFIGVSSVKQPDGSERATEIHVFPEALRGLGEGSYMMGGGGSGQATGSRMTNGQVSGANKPAGGSRMTNGSVSEASGNRKLMVTFNGGKESIAIPADVPVTEIVPVNKKVMPGDTVVLQARQAPDGKLAANMVMLRNPPGSAPAK